METLARVLGLLSRVFAYDYINTWTIFHSANGGYFMIIKRLAWAASCHLFR